MYEIERERKRERDEKKKRGAQTDRTRYRERQLEKETDREWQRRDRGIETEADILACLLDLNFKQSKLTRLNF